MEGVESGQESLTPEFLVNFTLKLLFFAKEGLLFMFKL